MPRASIPAEPRGRPSGTTPLPLASLMLPSTVSNASASATASFRDSVPRPAHSLSTLRGHGYPCASYDHARLASRWRPCLGGTGVQPAGLRTRFRYVFGFTWHPPGRGFLGARRKREEAREGEGGCSTVSRLLWRKEAAKPRRCAAHPAEFASREGARRCSSARRHAVERKNLALSADVRPRGTRGRVPRGPGT